MPNEYKLKDSARLAVAISAAFPFAAIGAGAGKIDFAAGNAVATTSDGRSRPLNKGSEVAAGETIDTREGRAQVRFTDGSQVALQPQTQFRIDDYSFGGKVDGSEKSFFSLLKGGLRTITGLIGKGDRNNYKVTTSVATIGIRGTEYSIAYGNSISVTAAEGSIEVCNSAGCMILNSGESGTVTSSSTAPIRVQARTSLPPPQPIQSQRPLFTVSESSQAFLPSGTGYSMAVAGHFNDGDSPFIDSSATGTALFKSGTGQMNRYEYLFDGGEFGSGGLFHYDASTHAGAFTDGIIGWGRMISAAASLDGPEGGTSSVRDMHYVVGRPTPDADMSLLHSHNVTGTYELSGFTFPTATNGAVGGRVSGAMTANFGSHSLHWALGVPIGGHNFGIAGSSSSWSGAQFAGSVSCVSGCCSGGSFAGFFAGANAARAGLVYKFDSETSMGTVTGAAVFKQTGLSASEEVALGRRRR
ncbi:MAG: FecR domain-containing protein [Rhodocyclaceae bacterium]|nr:FecR domain-containing protein [Rhodocyclaceae bacterium]